MQNQTQWQLQKDQVTWKDRSDAVRFLRDKEVKGNQNTPMEMKDLALARAADWSVPPVGTEWLYIAMTMAWNEWEDYKRRASVARRQLGPPAPLPWWKSRLIDLLLAHLCVWQPQPGSSSLLDSQRAVASAASWRFGKPTWWSRPGQRTFLPPDLEMRIYAPLPAACHPSSLSVAL